MQTSQRCRDPTELRKKEKTWAGRCNANEIDKGKETNIRSLKRRRQMKCTDIQGKFVREKRVETKRKVDEITPFPCFVYDVGGYII